jgi:hypothetical protein
VHAPTCLQHLQGWQGSGREGLDCEGGGWLVRTPFRE